MNSTIIGQRKPKENKRKKKKRQQNRRNSEGDASDYEPPPHIQKSLLHPTKAFTDADSDQNKQIKNSLIFDIEI